MQNKHKKSIIAGLAMYLALATGVGTLLAQPVPEMEPPSTRWVLISR